MKLKDQRIFLEALDELEKEKGIIKEELFEAIETALIAAYKKNYGEKENAEISVNRQTGEVKVFSRKTVVENVENPEEEISIEEAYLLKKRVKPGDVISLEISAEGFKRNAILNAKQIVVQKVRESEKKNIFNKFKKIENSIISAVVRKTDEKGNLFIDINGLEAVIPGKELSEADKFVQGDRIKAYVGEVEETSKFTKCFISRKSEELLKGLLDIEIPEIEENIIIVKNIAREAGSRTKIAVYSEDENLDIKGACIGKNGIRIQSIISELRGEKVDIVIWSPDIETFVKNALNPAEVLWVDIVEENEQRIARVYVKEDQLSLAIGKKGQNSRLAARLCSIKIDIHTVSEEDAKEKENIEEVSEITDEEKPKRKRRSKKEEDVPSVEAAGEEENPSEEMPEEEPKPKRGRKKAVKEEATEVSKITDEEKPKRKRRSKKEEDVPSVEVAGEEEDPSEEMPEEEPKPKRGRKKAVKEEQEDDK